jgi:hypothetical protein
MTLRLRGIARWIIVPLVFTAAELDARALTPLPIELNRPDSTATAGDITGTWQGTFQLDSAWNLPERATTRSVPARLTFAPVGDATPTTSSARSVHPGTFDVEFHRFGFTLSTQEALGWSVGADSMRAQLNPTVERGVVEVHGTFRGDVITGTWRYASDGGGARGTFRLRKSPSR